MFLYHLTSLITSAIPLTISQFYLYIEKSNDHLKIIYCVKIKRYHVPAI